ncbi:PHP domain-containing protein [Chloroflexus sp.]|uniref:PHP domain-containing protein n=1 Tax=Chloroflexus sp. TaxID=1904827 RepID=UPI002609EE9A|nr:PHP domain-containing protein [uncultured Chloroflexus sp.]
MIDLHIHTNATPHHATWTPVALAVAAAARGLTMIAVTDHNTTANVITTAMAGMHYGVRVISGVEIDSAFGGKLWHTLVYGVDPEAPALLDLCAEVVQRNAADAAQLMRDLPAAGFVLPGMTDRDRPPTVAEVATTLARHNDLPGRVVGEGDEEAGMRFILTHFAAAYHPVGVHEIISVAHDLGGLAVLAHPGREKGIYAIPATDEDIAALAAAGLDGIEVYYPTHDAATRARLLNAAARYGLLVSGGSDSHHPHQDLAAWREQDLTIVAQLRG